MKMNLPNKLTFLRLCLVPVLVMTISALLMIVCGLLMKKLKWKWLNDYALPICMMLGMVSGIPLTMWLGGAI